MFQKIINFIKYHNAFAIGITLVLFLTFSAMASEDVRNAVIGEEIVTEQGIDNSQLLSADMENFNINLKINNVLEDEENYYVDYAFNTIAVRDNIWQPVVKSGKFTVNKNALGNRDLGIYLAEELSETVRSEVAFLKEAQKNEKERGKTQIVKTTDYTGLIGLTLNLKNKILPGYEPVVKPPVAEIVQELIVQEPVCQPTTEICDGIDNNCDGIVDNSEICQPQPPALPAEDVCNTTHLNLCQNEADCTTVSGYWHNGGCNSEPEASACVPNWQCTDWQLLPETRTCGQTFTQTRTCVDSNNCGIDEGKPVEAQSASGVKCEASNSTGICQSGGCNFTCSEGFSNCDNNWLNGCETASSTCPTPEP